MVKAFHTPSDGRTWYAWGFVDNQDGLFYRTRPFRDTYERALANAHYGDLR